VIGGRNNKPCDRLLTTIAGLTLTPYHAKYYAYELTRRCPPDSEDRLASALVDAQVDLNPHQIDVALFAFRSPLSRGVLLADEVGLGKTIEAGLVLAQKWAERKRRMLVITPSNLRKQWCAFGKPA
jgi:SNF2 family DNA or RNA helicase